MKVFAIVYEKSATGWGAYVPDLLGLGVAADTFEAADKLIREGIEFHLEGMALYGDSAG